MQTKKLVAVTLAVALVFGGVFGYRQSSYAYHLNKARSSLVKLERALGGQRQPMALVPAVHAGGSDVLVPDGEGGTVTVDQEEVAELTDEVVESTEAAIELVEEVDQTEELEAALEAVGDVQEASLEVFGDAATILEEPDAALTVVAAIETTADQQDQVADALETVDAAIEAGEETVPDVDVTTTDDVEAALEEEGVDDLGAADEEAEPEAEGGEPPEEEAGEDEDAGHKVTLCHVPPGNPDNAHTIRVGGPALRAHVRHGDTLGACGTSEDEEGVATPDVLLESLQAASALKAERAGVRHRAKKALRIDKKIAALADIQTAVSVEGLDVPESALEAQNDLLTSARGAAEAGDLREARRLVREAKQGLIKQKGLKEVVKRVQKTKFLERKSGEGSRPPSKLDIKTLKQKAPFHQGPSDQRSTPAKREKERPQIKAKTKALLKDGGKDGLIKKAREELKREIPDKKRSPVKKRENVRQKVREEVKSNVREQIIKEEVKKEVKKRVKEESPSPPPKKDSAGSGGDSKKRGSKSKR